MEKYKPIPTLGGIIGFCLFVIFTTIIGGGLSYALAESSTAIKVMLMVPFALFALIAFYIVLSFFNIKYIVSDSALKITWGIYRKIIPWSSVQAIERIEGLPKIWGVFGIKLPGYHVGAFNITGLGVMTLFGTKVEDNLIIFRTEDGVYGITPVHKDCFLETIQRKCHLVAQLIDLDDDKDSLLQTVPSEDNIYLALAGLNLICLLAFLAYIVAFYPGAVQAAVAQGATPPPREIILLGVIAVAAFLLNIGSTQKIYQNMAAGSYLMWGIGIFINIFFLTLSVYVIGFGL